MGAKTGVQVTNQVHQAVSEIKSGIGFDVEIAALKKSVLESFTSSAAEKKAARRQQLKRAHKEFGVPKETSAAR